MSTLVLIDYIERGLEWELPSNMRTKFFDAVAPVIDGKTISDVIDTHSHLPVEFQLLLDDDMMVYQLVLIDRCDLDSYDPFEAIDQAEYEHGCTICVYKESNNKDEWNIL